MYNLDTEQNVLFLFRVRLGEKYSDFKGHYLTLGKLYKINNSQDDFNKLYEVLKELLDTKEENYKNLTLQQITI